MLNPGDKCPCCGAVIPADIPPENLAALRDIDIYERRKRGEISQEQAHAMYLDVMELLNKSKN